MTLITAYTYTVTVRKAFRPRNGLGRHDDVRPAIRATGSINNAPAT